MSESKWYDLSEGNEKKFSIDELKFIFGQSEKFLKQTFDTSAIIVTRSTILLTTFITLAISDFVYIIDQLSLIRSNKEGKTTDYHILFTAFSIFIYFIFLASKAIENIKSYDYDSIGNDPKDLLHDYFPLTESNEKEREKLYYRDTIKKMKSRIDHNNGLNKIRWAILNRILWHIQYGMLAVIVLSYILSYPLAYLWLNYISTNSHAI